MEKGLEFIPGLVLNRSDKNRLFPVFLKLEELEVLVVGAGKVGLEKLTAVLHNAPATSVTVVAKDISEAVKMMANLYPRLKLVERVFEPGDLDDKEIVIVAVNDIPTSNYIRVLSKQKKLLINVA